MGVLGPAERPGDHHGGRLSRPFGRAHVLVPQLGDQSPARLGVPAGQGATAAVEALFTGPGRLWLHAAEGQAAGAQAAPLRHSSERRLCPAGPRPGWAPEYELLTCYVG